MKTRRTIVLTALMALVVGACGTAASPSPSAPASAAPTASAAASASASAEAVGLGVGRADRAAGRPEGSGHPGRGAGRDHRVLDVLPVAHLRPVHQGHDRPIPGDVSGRHGLVGRPPGHVQGRPQQLVRRGQRAGRHQPLGQRGLGQRVRGQGPAARPRHAGPAGRQGHLLPEPLEAAAHRRRELPVPVVPGPQRRAAQQGALREGRGRPRLLPQDDRRPPGPVQDVPRQGGRPVRHPPDRQRPARPDGLRGQRQGLQRRRQVLHLQLARRRGVAADVRRHGHRRDARPDRPDRR